MANIGNLFFYSFRKKSWGWSWEGKGLKSRKERGKKTVSQDLYLYTNFSQLAKFFFIVTKNQQ